MSFTLYPAATASLGVLNFCGGIFAAALLLGLGVAVGAALACGSCCAESGSVGEMAAGLAARLGSGSWSGIRQMRSCRWWRRLCRWNVYALPPSASVLGSSPANTAHYLVPFLVTIPDDLAFPKVVIQLFPPLHSLSGNCGEPSLLGP